VDAGHRGGAEDFLVDDTAGEEGGAEDVDLLARGDSGKNGTQCLLSP
jgi:hypothetical protein